MCHRNQNVFDTDRVLFDVAEFQKALMAGAMLPAMYDAPVFTIVLQQLGVGHASSPVEPEWLSASVDS